MDEPYLTADLPGVGGRIKVDYDDFTVQEIPLYLPSGQGQHTYVTLEKRGLSTFQAVSRIARAVGVDPQSVGYAGLKDAHAVTVQTISLFDVPPEQIERRAEGTLSGIRILSVSRHTNKIKIGHLRGNRFTIRVRDVAPDALPAAQAILDVLARRGVPNYFGEQRFGVRGDTHLLGRELVRQDDEAFLRRYLGMPHPAESPQVRQARALFDQGDLPASLAAWPPSMQEERRVLQVLRDRPSEPARALRALPVKVRRFFFSAYQGALFNRILARRLPTVDRLEVGDLAWLHDRGAVFLVEDPQAEQPRADRLEISPSGPLYGYKMTPAQGAPGELEAQVLAEEGVTLPDWHVPGLQLKGARRPLRFPLREARVEYDAGRDPGGAQPSLVLSFSLPAGCYATVVLAEVMKAGQ
jgi:tRNA pseudouridine13 synthase